MSMKQVCQGENFLAKEGSVDEDLLEVVEVAGSGHNPIVGLSVKSQALKEKALSFQEFGGHRHSSDGFCLAVGKPHVALVFA